MGYMNEQEFYAKLGGMVREERKKKGISQTDLAKTVEVSQPDLSAFEKRGDKIRSAFKISALCRAVGLEFLPSQEKKTRFTASSASLCPS